MDLVKRTTNKLLKTVGLQAEAERDERLEAYSKKLDYLDNVISGLKDNFNKYALTVIAMRCPARLWLIDN